MSIIIHCNETDNGAFSFLSTEYRGVYVKEIAVGQVVYLRERNMYDDSDFFAGFWNTETNAIEEVMYGTTRCWTIGSATVDASDIIRAKYDAWRTEQQTIADNLRAQELAKMPAVGKKVIIVKASRSNAKFLNKNGTVTWVGNSKFKFDQKIARVEVEGVKAFFDVNQLVVVDSI